MLLRPIALSEVNPMRRPLVRIAGRPAFTLLEVLVVVAILVILASVATFATMGYLEKAKESQAKLQMSKIATACESYYTQNDGTWPDNLIQLTQPPTALLVGGQSAVTDPWGQPYTMTPTQDNTGQTRALITCAGPPGQNRPITWPTK